MSGRIYDYLDGVPICSECGGKALRADECNFWGTYCPNCKKYVFCDIYDDKDPDWIAYHKELITRCAPFIEFDYHLGKYKK
jgi:hypothetical protein